MYTYYICIHIIYVYIYRCEMKLFALNVPAASAKCINVFLSGLSS